MRHPQGLEFSKYEKTDLFEPFQKRLALELRISLRQYHMDNYKLEIIFISNKLNPKQQKFTFTETQIQNCSYLTETNKSIEQLSKNVQMRFFEGGELDQSPGPENWSIILFFIMMQTPPRTQQKIKILRTHNNSAFEAYYGGELQSDKQITGQVDHYLQTTYQGLASNKIDSLCKAQLAPSNSLLINYIRHIQSKYALEDPMKKYGDQRYWGSAETHSSTAQKQSPMRAPSQPNQPQVVTSQIHVNPEVPANQSRYLTPEKELVASRMTKASHSFQTQGSAGPERATLGMSPGASVKNSLAENTKEIEAVFRFCFECEKSILEYNMLNHEKNCPGFMALYQKTTPEIIELLEAKIERIKQDVIAVLNFKEESRLNNLKQATVTWLAAVEQSQKTKVLSWEYEKEYSRIKDCYKSPELMILELSYKLRWFMRIREELKNKFGI